MAESADLADVRLAGWRVKKEGQGNDELEEQMMHEERAQRMATPDIAPEAGDVVEYVIPERLVDENDGR